MQRKDILIAGWEAAHDKEDWYPPLKAALDGVDYEQSLWKAPGNASHTIGELVDHLLYYKKRFLFRLEHKAWQSTINTNDETFSGNAARSSQDWKSTVDELASVHQRIQKQLEGLKDSDLDLKLPEASIGAQMLTLIMHDAYHTGQIIFIRKLNGSWPSVRET
jgi:uncharacterized damage-inducible protein DinB